MALYCQSLLGAKNTQLRSNLGNYNQELELEVFAFVFVVFQKVVGGGSLTVGNSGGLGVSIKHLMFVGIPDSVFVSNFLEVYSIAYFSPLLVVFSSLLLLSFC